jgi:predicted RNase H-like nuclease (RuvC/YqgF family)
MSEEFFSNRELYELIQQTAKEMAELKKEMAETRAIIRDYNALRKKVEQTDTRVNTLMWVVGVSVPVLGLLFTFLNYIGR